MAEAPPVPQLLPEGSWAGAYQIAGVLRQGALGTVYAARSRGQGPEVALEILHDLHPDPSHLARCQREAAAAGRVGHPAILAPTEQGVLPDGRAYSVLEKLEGESLQARLDRRGSLPLGEVAPWLDGVMEALGAAHAAGLVHRDLTPSNLFLQSGPHGQVHLRILDFGISQLASGEAQLGPQITREGQVLGSARYLAPEQASASYGGVGPWTDVYALGAIAFHLLAGRPPYVAATPGEVVLAHLQAPIPSLRDHRPGLPLALDAALKQALAKRPEGRFATMEAFRRAFRGSLRGSVVLPVAPELDGLAPPHPGRPGQDAPGSHEPAGAFDLARTLPPEAALGTDDTVPPYLDAQGAVRPPGAPLGNAATIDPTQRAAWAATLRPEAFEKPPAPPAAVPAPAPVSPWHRDRDSLEQAPVELEARALSGLGPAPPKSAEPELRRPAPPPPMPGLPSLPAPARGRAWLWILVGLAALGALTALLWILIGR